MQAILFTERGQARLKARATPKPATDEVLLEVHASGICHTDLEILNGNYGSSAFPLTPGHEYAGIVMETGAEVTNIAPGDRVVVDPNLSCGTCRACKRGWGHLCTRLGAYGVSTHGGFAEFSVVKASAVHPIGDMPFDLAALAEPAGCALNGLQAARAEQAETALIFGAGPIGMMLAIGLRASGVTEIALVERDEAKLGFIESFGFTALASGSAALAAERHARDLVIDATGQPTVAAVLTHYIADGGTGLFFGVCPADATVEIAPFELFRRQLSLVGSHSLNHNIPEALSMLRAEPAALTRLVSHRLPLAEVAQVFAGARPEGGMKIQAIRD